MICVLGGTFDPVHFGHLRPALEVQQALGVPRVHLLPCRHPPHRDPPNLGAGQRLELLRLAVEDEAALAIDERELWRDGPSYMVDTLESLRADCRTQPLCLALGMDAFLGLQGWRRWEELTALCHLVVMLRPGSDWPHEGVLAALLARSRADTADALRQQPAGLVLGVAVTRLSISSTRIRTLLAAGESVRYLLPDKVLMRIKQERWYAD